MNNIKFKLIYENLLPGFLTLMLVPFLILFLYIHPYNDDLTFGYIFKTNGFIDSQIFVYTRWAGRYFASAVLGLNPLIYDSFTGYKIFTFLLLISFFSVFLYFISELTKIFLNIKERFLLTLSILFLFFYSMPIISEGIYWMAGSVFYLVGLMMLMIFLVLYTKLNKTENSSSNSLTFILSAFFLFALIGCNELSMFIGNLLLLLIVLNNLLTKKKLDSKLIIYLLISVIFTYIAVSAPGNSLRGSKFSNTHNLILSIQLTVKALAFYLKSWILLSPLIPVSILLSPLLIKLGNFLENTKKSFLTNPLYVSFILLIVLVICFFVPAWSMGMAPYERTVNFIFFVFLLGWFYVMILIFKFLSDKYKFSADRIPQYAYIIAFTVIVLFLFKKNNIKDAYSDLLKGRAAAFNNEQFARYDLIYNNSSDSLTVPPIVNKPYSIFLGDLYTDPKDRLNVLYAQYFNKKSVSVTETDSLEK